MKIISMKHANITQWHTVNQIKLKSCYYFCFKLWQKLYFVCSNITFFTATVQEASWDVHVMRQIAAKRLQKPLSGHFSMWVHTACVCVGLRNVFMIKLDFHSGLFCDTDDTTRVVLKGTDDYINANFINVSNHHWLWLFKSYFVNVLFLENCHLYIFVCLQMKIPGKGEVKRYIACQGPLPGTCSDFWQMMWEQSTTLVVMLTTQVERGRVCKYFIEMIHRHKGGKKSTFIY